MTTPSNPNDSTDIELPCGEWLNPRDIDIGMREFDCACGRSHAIVTDVHPLTRFIPREIVDTLTEVVETDDQFETFSTAHALGMVREEFPAEVVSTECADDGQVGYALLWVSEFDSRRLHEIIVELLIELMDHAIGHASNEEQIAEFDRYLEQFDVSAFVEEYRNNRNFDSEYDTPV